MCDVDVVHRPVISVVETSLSLCFVVETLCLSVSVRPVDVVYQHVVPATSHRPNHPCSDCTVSELDLTGGYC